MLFVSFVEAELEARRFQQYRCSMRLFSKLRHLIWVTIYVSSFVLGWTYSAPIRAVIFGS
jgi:hypothetical protein